MDFPSTLPRLPVSQIAPPKSLVPSEQASADSPGRTPLPGSLAGSRLWLQNQSDCFSIIPLPAGREDA